MSGDEIRTQVEQDVEVDQDPPQDLEPAVEQSDKIRGGGPAKPAFEIKDFSFGVENPSTIGSA